ncbi:MAG: glycosyltransferase family 4 protein [Flavobacteriaceae bacterium]|nr:glycosyltransferase family 4 protein [Flavobacteriaceae bacterium]
MTSMYPSAQKKYSGIFVKNQYEYLQKLIGDGDTIEIFFIRRRITSFIGSVLKHLVSFFKFIPHFFRKYDVVHLHSFFPLIVSAWLYKTLYPKTKLVVTFHGMEVNLQVNKRNEKFMRFLAKKIDFTIPVGIEVGKNVVNKLRLPIGKILPVGVNPNVFYPEPHTQKEYNFLFVGSFFVVKGIDILYNAIINLPKDIRFCIVGNGEEYQQKFSDLKLKGYTIELKGDQTHEELRKVYNQSRFLILPSRSEGFATVIVEAMYCGTPVITSNIPQFLEQVIENKNGFMFPLDEPQKLEVLLGNLMKISPSQYQTLTLNAKESFKEISLEAICKELMIIYRK